MQSKDGDSQIRKDEGVEESRREYRKIRIPSVSEAFAVKGGARGRGTGN